jgi:hypothetical protein
MTVPLAQALRASGAHVLVAEDVEQARRTCRRFTARLAVASVDRRQHETAQVLARVVRERDVAAGGKMRPGMT